MILTCKQALIQTYNIFHLKFKKLLSKLANWSEIWTSVLIWHSDTEKYMYNVKELYNFKFGF